CARSTSLSSIYDCFDEAPRLARHVPWTSLRLVPGGSMTTRCSVSTVLALGVVCSLSFHARGQRPTVQIPNPGVPPIMTLEGNSVRAAYNNEGYVTRGYQIANRTIGSDWIMLDVGLTLMEDVKNYTLKRDALSLDTPDGNVPLPSIEEYRKNEVKVQPL